MVQIIDESHKSLAGLYPWFALFVLQKISIRFQIWTPQDRNIFADSQITALSSILAGIAVKFNNYNFTLEWAERERVVALMNNYKPPNKKFSHLKMSNHMLEEITLKKDMKI